MNFGISFKVLILIKPLFKAFRHYKPVSINI